MKYIRKRIYTFVVEFVQLQNVMLLFVWFIILNINTNRL